MGLFTDGFKLLKKASEPLYKTPKSIQETIEIMAVAENGIFEVSRNKYSKCYRFQDINYTTATEDEQIGIFERYCKFLNSLDCNYKITINNKNKNMENLRDKVLITEKNDGFNNYRRIYNDIIEEKIIEGRQGIEQERYLTITIERKNFEEAKTQFATLEATIHKAFIELGAEIVPLNGNERLKVLYDYYHLGDEGSFDFDIKKAKKVGADFKNDLCNGMVKYFPDHIVDESKYCKALFIKKYPSSLSDRFINEITYLPVHSITSIDVVPVPKDLTTKVLQKKYLGIESDIIKQQRVRNKNNDFSTEISYAKRTEKKEIEAIMDDVRENDQCLFFVGVTIILMAESKKELESVCETVETIGKRNSCTIDTHYLKQREALNTALPIGVRQVETMRTLLTQSLAVLMPFNVQELNDSTGNYYGINQIRDIVNVINAATRSPDQPVWAVEGDIKGCFDNIGHRILLQKIWHIGIHDKRVIKMIQQMLKAGYIESGILNDTKLGTMQGGILSPLLSNVYLNDFDWFVGRMYMEPHRQCKHKCNDTRRLKWSGVTPKYNFRFADDWVILTSTEQEAYRLKRMLTKYFKNKMKLELSQEKTFVTDLRTEGIHFLGFVVKAEKKRKTPDPRTWTENLVGKPLPDMERLKDKIRKIADEVRVIGEITERSVQAAQIQRINSMIVGLAQYLQPSICSHAFHAIDRRINNTALAVWKRRFPKHYNKYQISMEKLCNLPHRHEGYKSKTFAVPIEGEWFGITMAFITHSKYESKPFDQRMTPYTEEGRRIYSYYRSKSKPLPCDRPSVNTVKDIQLSVYAKTVFNFEYFMNREYAYNRDKGKCKCCKKPLFLDDKKFCYHIKGELPLEKINKVQNLIWLCNDCYRMVNNGPIPPDIDEKVLKKIQKYKQK